MRYRRPTRGGNRCGKILLATALLMPVFLGVVALVLETGVLMSRQSQLRDLADSTARIAARELYRGGTAEEAIAAAESFIEQHALQSFGTPPALQVISPPSSGLYAGDGHYIEVRLSGVIVTTFARFLGAASSESVSARSVAGYEPISRGARIVALNADAAPGFALVGAGVVSVDGGVVVNSRGGGFNEAGELLGVGPDALVVNGAAQLYADDVQVAGGVNNPENILPLDPDDRHPLRAGSRVQEDPLAHLPVPTLSQGAVDQHRGFARVTGGSAMVSGGNYVAADGWVVLKPGIYDYIHIAGGRVRLEAGIYILAGGHVTTLQITGGEVDGTAGVLFYNTGDDFDVVTGQPDTQDSINTGRPAMTRFGRIFLTSMPRLRPLDAGSELDGLVVMQRRRNDEQITIAGNQSDAMVGTLYARESHFMITGQGIFNNNIVVGSLSKTGNGNLTLMSDVEAPLTPSKVFLVE